MATIGNLAVTYADWAKRMDDGYKVASIIEILSQTNEILDDMLVMEGNLPTGHKTTIRTGLPQATWRLLNAGVPNAKSTTAQIVDTCGNLETYAVIDKDIADLNGNTADFRLYEVRAFLEGMTQQDYASRIGLSLPAAKSRVQRARARLKTHLSCFCQVSFDGDGHVAGFVPRPPAG